MAKQRNADVATENVAVLVEIRPIEALIPYARNSRKHSDEQVAHLSGLIAEFGWTNPVLADEKGIVAGHGRVMAASRIYASGQTIKLPDGRALPAGAVPVIDCTGWSEPQRRAYVIADNQSALMADWDYDMLAIELEELRGLDFDINLVGFSADELADIEQDEKPGDVVADAEVDEAPARVSYGQVWILGDHRLMCGDSSCVPDIEKLLSGVTPDLLVYDPPYEVSEAWNWYFPAASALVFSDYRHVKAAMKVASNYAHNYQFVWDCCTSWYNQNRPLARHKTAFFCSNDPTWDFDAAVYQDGKKREAKTVSNTRGDLDYKPLADGFVHLQTVYQEPNTQQDSAHAHAKPVKWLNALMRGAGGGTILDLFGGSGATIIAAPSGARVYAMEIDPRSCDRIISRWELATGGSAVLA